MTPSLDTLRALRFGQRFRVLSEVARGGFGVVFRGIDEPSGWPVAIKVLHAHASPLAARLLATEAAALSRLSHPSIVRYFGAGIEQVTGEPLPWLAMAWCEGTTLRDDLKKRRGSRGRSRSEAWALFEPIAEALASAHAVGLVHRDLKPANVMLVSRQRTVLPCVIDWGIGKEVGPAVEPGSGDTSTLTTKVAYTAAYAAPEQVSGTRTGPWTDVHALALLLTELLVDAAPYGEGEAIAAFDPVRPTPRTFGVDAGPWEPVLERALALLPTNRYRDAGQLLQALRETAPSTQTLASTLMMDSPVSREPTTNPSAPALTSPPSPSRRTSRARIALVSLVAVGVAGGLAALAWLLFRGRRRRR